MQVVRIDNNGRALEHVVHVSKSANDEVMFVALGGGPWKVTFDKAGHTPAGSPFNEATYIVQLGGVVKMGEPKATAVVGTIRTTSGTLTVMSSRTTPTSTSILSRGYAR